MLFSAADLYLNYGMGPVLDHVSLDAKEGEKIGLVGLNGCGKSTLLKVLADHEPTQGKIIRTKGMKVHLLEQNPHFSQVTIIDEMKTQNAKLKEPREEYELKSILTRLGLNEMNQEISTLSGGQQKRLALALALADRADLLLLDEPTNHLDIDMINWLENWLNKSKQTVITVTHDRYFLERACTRILELDHGKLYSHEGSFETYLQAKAQRELDEDNRAKKRENLYRKELEWVRAGVQARSTKSKSRLDRFEQLRNERTKKVNQTMDLRFPAERLGKKTLEWRNITFAYPDQDFLFSDFSYLCKRTDRLAFVGENGTGKSTFLNLVAGMLKPIMGEFEYGQTVKIGYFRQIMPFEDLSKRVIDYIEENASKVETLEGTLTASAMLERFMFDKNKQYLPIERLSGGERRRLYLVKVLMEAPNVLLLDEPGNDLDITTMEVLEDYLDSFPGIVMFVSHDRYFIDRIANEVFELQADCKWHRYTGGYSDLVYAHEQEKKDLEATTVKPKATTKTRRPSLSYMEKKELEQLLVKMETLQKHRDELNEQMGQTTEYAKLAEIEKERDELQEQIDEAEMRWLELEEKKEQYQAM